MNSTVVEGSVPLGSQEEYLFHNTSLSASLWPHRRRDDERWSEGSALLGRSSDPFYPLSQCGGIYSPHVDVVSVLGKPLPRKPRIAVLSIAAQDLRPGRRYNAGAAFDPDLLVGKLRTLLFMAAAHGHRRLVLGALGCGAFRNPPAEVAGAVHRLLAADGAEFAGRFDAVAFAVTRSASNLSAFEAAFGPALGRAGLLADAPGLAGAPDPSRADSLSE